jgi:hypothetical protein
MEVKMDEKIDAAIAAVEAYRKAELQIAKCAVDLTSALIAERWSAPWIAKCIKWSKTTVYDVANKKVNANARFLESIIQFAKNPQKRSRKTPEATQSHSHGA